MNYWVKTCVPSPIPDLVTRQRTRPSIKRDVSPGLPQSYSEDFTGGSPASSNVHSIALDSPDFSRVGRSPIPSSASADSISQLVTPKSRSSGKVLFKPSAVPRVANHSVLSSKLLFFSHQIRFLNNFFFFLLFNEVFLFCIPHIKQLP